jgi:hypothetical protein
MQPTHNYPFIQVAAPGMGNRVICFPAFGGNGDANDITVLSGPAGSVLFEVRVSCFEVHGYFFAARQIS